MKQTRRQLLQAFLAAGFGVRSTAQDESVKTREEKIHAALQSAIVVEDDKKIKTLIHENPILLTQEIVVSAYTPLLFAIYAEKYKSCETLIGLGADVNAPHYNRYDTKPGEAQLVHAMTPLWQAISNKKPKMVALLLRHGADPRKAISVIEPREFGLTVPSYEGHTCLHAAVESGSAVIAEMLLNHGGVDIETQDGRGMSALHFAVSRRELDIIKILLKYGANIGARTGDRRPDIKQKQIAQFASVLHLALENYNIPLAEMLIKDYAANPQIVDVDGMTPLMVAAGRGELNAARMLLEQPAVDRNAVNPLTDDTALHYAYRHSHLRIIELLEEIGVDKNKKNNEGKTPAELKEREEVWAERLHLQAFAAQSNSRET